MDMEFEALLDGDTLEAIQGVLDRESRDHLDVAEHAMRVRDTAMAIGREMGLDDHGLALLSLGTRVHDVGKMFIPSAVLRKPGRLDAEERGIIETHAAKGADLLCVIPGVPREAIEIARYHHERYDGTGYEGLSGEDIPPLARITEIADVHDALISPRAYKEAMTEGQVLSIMTADVEGPLLGRRSFDPVMLRSFVAMRLVDPEAHFTDEERMDLEIYAGSDPMGDLAPDADGVHRIEIDFDGSRRVLGADGEYAHFDALGRTVTPTYAKTLVAG